MKNKRIVIYGVGDYGKRLYFFLKSIGNRVDFFCQTCSYDETSYDGIKIINLNELSEIKGELIIFIAICDKKTSNLVKKKLLQLNRNDICIYEFGEFISNNIMGINEASNVHYCNICGKRVEKFESAHWPGKELFEKHYVIGGGGYRENIYCPICHSTERRRWQHWVLAKHTNILKSKCSVLHIAPESEISPQIESNELCDYYTGNIVPGAKYRVDVTDIQFRDSYFDYIIINHVLEHITNQERAISELRRVLKVNGKIIISFPICMDMDTYENVNVKTAEERLAEYGQEDHVRLYGRDYREVLERYGLEIKKIFSPHDECSEDEIFRYGFAEDDIILICGK